MLDPDKQREFAVEAVRALRAAGFEAYWAGGCVRDRLLGRRPKDYDVGTTATPQQIRQVFGPQRTIAVGAQFGVIAVLGRPKSAGQVEVATFRRDLAYSDGRRPDAVEFCTPEADAARRDFTINGMFYDPLEDRVIDYVGGVSDLGRGIVRAIGDPAARFQEDKLRLLRAVRFAATFDFALEPGTRQAVEAMAGKIVVVSAERIAAEMRGMLAHPRRAAAIDLLHEVGLLPVLLPELAMANRHGGRTAVDRSTDEAWLTALETLDALADAAEFPLALAALLGPFVDARGAAEVARRWKLSNEEAKRIGWLVEHRGALADAPRLPWSRLQPLLVARWGPDLVALEAATSLARGAPTTSADYCAAQLRRPAQALDPAPLVGGDDLIAHGVARGRHYQRLLKAVREAQLDGQIASRDEALALVDRLLREDKPQA